MASNKGLGKGLGALLGENGDCLELFCQLPEDERLFYKYFTEYPGVN